MSRIEDIEIGKCNEIVSSHFKTHFLLISANWDSNLFRLIIPQMRASMYQKYCSTRYVGSKCGSNGNYDRNDGFSMPQIRNKTGKENFILFRKDTTSPTRLALWSRWPASRSSQFFTRSLGSSLTRPSILLRQLYRNVLNFKTFHVIARKQPRNTCIGQSPHISI